MDLGHSFPIKGLTKAHPGDWYLGWLGKGIFYGTIGRVMIDMLILQTLFLAVLFAVLVNLRKSWRLKPKRGLNLALLHRGHLPAAPNVQPYEVLCLTASQFFAQLPV